MKKKLSILFAFLFVVLLIGILPRAGIAAKTEILWDRWGVPHIFAPDFPSLFRAFGRAQMESHGNLILKLYGQARGRAAEYWGESYLQSDTIVQTLGLPDLARKSLEAQNPEFRRCLEAFVSGMNEYAGRDGNPLTPEMKAVLPIAAEDVLAHAIRVIHGDFIAGGPVARAAAWQQKGSNGWAIGPAKSKSGRAMLLVNPHLVWSDLYLFYEAHLNAPGIKFYGATLVGFPVPAMGFNDRLGWTHTVNTYDGADLFELTLAEGGYRFDGEVTTFDSKTVALKVKQNDGTLREQPLVVRRSVHGPVVGQKSDRALALKIAGLDRFGMLEEWWELARASSLDEFQAILKKGQIPMFNFVYADRDGRIMLLHNGCIPVRPRGDFAFWYGTVPGDTSAMLWKKIHPFEDLPKVIDPPSGWLSNANEPPYYCTRPAVLDTKSFPQYFFPSPAAFCFHPMLPLRALRSVRMLTESSRLTLEDMISLKHSTRMELADRVLDELLAAVDQSGNPRAKKAAAVLKDWDRCAEAESRGAVLFDRWFSRIQMNLFARTWEENDLDGTPSGLKDPAAAVKALEEAADEVAAKYGSLDVAWGEVNRFRQGTTDLPANGGSTLLGIFRTMNFRPETDGKNRAVAGDTFVAAVEFADPVRARVLLSYGNSSEPGSQHLGDQLELLSKKELRPAWLDRSEIEKNLERREEL